VVRRRPDVIFAISNPLALDLKAATNTIPIVAMTADPIALGIVPSLAHPGGNITGVRVDAGLEIWAKRLEVLREVTGASTIGFLASPIAWDRYVPALREAAARLAVSIIGPPLQPPFTDTEYRRVLAAMREKGVQALIASDLPANLSHRELIAHVLAAGRGESLGFRAWPPSLCEVSHAPPDARGDRIVLRAEAGRK
jgi:putative tryptophan/tyrosine transport system substrate-binding protein